MQLRTWQRHLPPGSRFDVGDLTRSGTVLRRWVRLWADRPESPLFLDPDGIAGKSWWSAGAFEEATRGVAVRLLGAGLRPGDRVLWSTGSSVRALVAHVAALRAGLVVVPANPSYTERELAHIVADVRPGAAIVDSEQRRRWVRAASTAPIVVTGPDVDLPERDRGDQPLDEAEPHHPALICFTSGTAGVPKGAVLTHRNLLAGTEAVRWAWRWTEEDRLIHALPVFHAHGLCVGIYGTLSAGGSAVLLPGFDPARVAEVARHRRASLFFGVPTMYHRLLGAGHMVDLRRLRLCVSGSAPLPVDLHRACSAAIGQAVLERYGMTETLMNVSNPYDGERRPGTVGVPLPGVEVCLDRDGLIKVRGSNVFSRYWERPAATADAFDVDAGDGDGDSDGGPWFRTGDLGEVDAAGYLRIRGRTTELIISGGYNVYPAEVEDVLATHPGVHEVAVTGTPSEEWGEVVTAWVVPEGPVPALEDLLVVVADRLAPYKWPRAVHVVDALPRNALGKVVRSRLGS